MKDIADGVVPTGQHFKLQACYISLFFTNLHIFKWDESRTDYKEFKQQDEEISFKDGNKEVPWPKQVFDKITSYGFMQF